MIIQPVPPHQCYWYYCRNYCRNPPGYYPYLSQDPGGWLKVVSPHEPAGTVEGAMEWLRPREYSCLSR